MPEPVPNIGEFFEASPNPYLVLDRRLHIAAANRAYLAGTGRELSDIVGRWAWDAFPTDPDTLAKSIASFERVIATGQPDTMDLLRFDIPNAAVEGGFERRFWSLVHSPVLGSDGEVTYVIQHALDVTEKVDAQAELRESEARYRQIVEGAEDFAIVRLDDHGIITGWNNGAQRIMGFSRDEAIGQRGGLFFTPEDCAAGAPDHEMNRASSDRRAVDERWHLRKDGSRFWGSGLMMRLEGSGDGYLKMFRDRTAEHEAEAAVRELTTTLEERVAARTGERNLFATLFETTDVLVAALDLDYNILAGNAAFDGEFERVYGVRPKVGDNVLELLADRPEEQASVRAGWARALAGEEFTFVEEFGDAALNRPHYEVKFRVLRDAAGKRIGAYQFVTDVSDRLRAQAELLKAQEALRQSQKMDAVGQLTGGVAHDFNNLLTVISGSVEMLQRPNLPEDKRARHVQAIGDTAKRATKLTGQLLAFARRQALRPEVFDLGAGVATVSEMIATLMGSRIATGTQLPSESLFVNADHSQFDTALVNMAINARDAMEGEGRLTIAVRATTSLPSIRAHPAVEGDFVAVSLTDTGSGIPADQLDQIFEPFFTTKSVGKGTGLGLSQVFGFARQSGGEVVVESEPGRGSTFTLYLPRVPEIGRVHSGPKSSEPSVRGEGACILVVEDNAQVGEFAVGALDELGFRTTLAGNAEAALARLAASEGGIDVVFSDVVMPGMNGIDLAQEIGRLYPDLPVVLASGYSHVLAEKGDHGFELLHKPYSIDQLSRVLQKVAVGRT